MRRLLAFSSLLWHDVARDGAGQHYCTDSEGVLPKDWRHERILGPGQMQTISYRSPAMKIESLTAVSGRTLRRWSFSIACTCLEGGKDWWCSNAGKGPFPYECCHVFLTISPMARVSLSGYRNNSTNDKMSARVNHAWPRSSGPGKRSAHFENVMVPGRDHCGCA
jgi:hypothetical protein